MFPSLKYTRSQGLGGGIMDVGVGRVPRSQHPRASGHVILGWGRCWFPGMRWMQISATREEVMGKYCQGLSEGRC